MHDRGRERLRVRDFGARLGRDLGLDIEPDVIGPGAPDQIEHLGKRGDRRAIDRALLGQARAVPGSGLQASDVVPLEFGQRQRADGRSLAFEKCTIGPARMVGIEMAVVAHHDRAVPGEREIEFERRHADR